jgi:ribosome-binding factor A
MSEFSEKARNPAASSRNSIRRIIQRDLYKRVVLKNSPSLTFIADDSVERGVRVLNLIENLPPPAADADGETKSDDAG